MLVKQAKALPECMTGTARKLWLTACTLVSRKRNVTYVYTTVWLKGRYAVCTHEGNASAMDLIVDQIVAMLPNEPTAALIADVRACPCVSIEEVF